jgi:2-polyprenyl-3-methyl-5-hydroxy-6-metoxy-1,4-benzoquinol methylase
VIGKDAFDVALIPGMRERLAGAYAQFRAAHAAFQEGESRIVERSTVRDRCPGCGAPSEETAALFTSRAMRHVRCRRCDLVYTLDILEESDDRALYQRNTAMAAYLTLKDDPAYAQLEANKAAYLASLARRFVAKPTTFLDIGCSTGELLAAAEHLGFDVRGVDANPDMVARARNRFGDRVAEGYFPGALPADWPRFGVIAILDVLEHMVDPKAFLAELSRHLEPGGVLLVQVPNFDSLIIQVEGPVNGNFQHGHWTHFTAATLAAVLESAGLETLWHETIISELDRINEFPRDKVAATLARLAPGDPKARERLDAEAIHRNLLGYKVIGVFRRGPQDYNSHR